MSKEGVAGMSELFEKITKVRLPFDMRHKDPSKNYGIHGLDVWFILKGPKGATQFAVMFPVYLPHIEYEKSSWGFEPRLSGIDVGYHAKVPQFEGHLSRECDLWEGNCFYDGSGLRADDWVSEIFSIKGKKLEPEIWKRLEAEYYERFGKEEAQP